MWRSRPNVALLQIGSMFLPRLHCAAVKTHSRCSSWNFQPVNFSSQEHRVLCSLFEIAFGNFGSNSWLILICVKWWTLKRKTHATSAYFKLRWKQKLKAGCCCSLLLLEFLQAFKFFLHCCFSLVWRPSIVQSALRFLSKSIKMMESGYWQKTSCTVMTAKPNASFLACHRWRVLVHPTLVPPTSHPLFFKKNKIKALYVGLAKSFI